MEIKVTLNDLAHLTQDVLIERVVPLLNDGYQNKSFEDVWALNGAF